MIALRPFASQTPDLQGTCTKILYKGNFQKCWIPSKNNKKTSYGVDGRDRCCTRKHSWGEDTRWSAASIITIYTYTSYCLGILKPLLNNTGWFQGGRDFLVYHARCIFIRVRLCMILSKESEANNCTLFLIVELRLPETIHRHSFSSLFLPIRVNHVFS